MLLCEICNKTEKKYCCPTCSSLYCSVSCYKKHKTDCNKDTTDEKKEEFAVDTKGALDDDGCYKYITADTVPLEKLKLLAASQELSQLLANPHLREFLQKLDDSDEKGWLMRKAMREPLFVEFVDVCLKTVNDNNKTREMSDQEVLQIVQEQIEND